jgi:hypothetical protein
MRKIIAFFILLSLFSNSVRINNIHKAAAASENSCSSLYVNTMKQDILSLMAGYPGYIEDIRKDNEGYVFLIMKSGRKIIYDDKKEKSFSQKLSNPDIQDMMEQIYPLEEAGKLSDINYDPGRSRVYGILEEVYGKSKNIVEKNLVNVYIGQGRCQFNKNNNASDALVSSMRELNDISKYKRNISGCLYPISGTYNYRVISGTKRLSPHSFGIAIDLARDKRDYWRWASREEGAKRAASYPYEIVDMFEKNNFIWGGKWGHFDILHFEYRPEIIFKARYFAEKKLDNRLWYDGKPDGDEYINECIVKIEKSL